MGTWNAYGIIATPFGDIPVEILDWDMMQKQGVGYYRLLKRTDAFPKMLVGDIGSIDAQLVITDDFERGKKAFALPIQDSVSARFALYEDVRDMIQQELAHNWTSGDIPFSAFMCHFGENEIPYIDAIVKCVQRNGLDMGFLWYGRESARRYCFICTGGICIRFGGFMWGDLLHYAGLARTIKPQAKIAHKKSSILRFISGLGKARTSESRHSDDYSETHTRSDKIGDI
jgi:hypothetical protein